AGHHHGLLFADEFSHRAAWHQCGRYPRVRTPVRFCYRLCPHCCSGVFSVVDLPSTEMGVNVTGRTNTPSRSHCLARYTWAIPLKNPCGTCSTRSRRMMTMRVLTAY